MKKFSISLFAFTFLFVGTGEAYLRITSSSGHSPRWSSIPIPYWIHERGLVQIPNGSEFLATQAGFRVWQETGRSSVSFDYRGTTSVRTVGHDGMNVVTFADDTVPIGAPTVAATFSFFRTESGQLFFDEADIVFNPVHSFSTSGERDKLDIQSVMTHEVGHVLGLEHSALVSSVMVPFAAASQVGQRVLQEDDIAAIAEIYPNASSSLQTGSIRGRIDSGTIAVFGAHVVAMDRNGTALISTVSQPDGTYEIRGLPPGPYRVYAEPLDLPVAEQHIGGGSTAFYRNLNTNFQTTYFGNVDSLAGARSVTVTAGSTTSAVDIQALPRSSTTLNITRPSFATRVSRGGRGTLRAGGNELVDGVSFATSDAGVSLGVPTFGGRIASTAPSSATMEVIVAPQVSLGPKNVIGIRGGAVSVLSGGIVIVDEAPSNIEVSPSSAPFEGGAIVSVSGGNFRDGARVFFGGLPATSIMFLNSSLLQATVPRNAPGPVQVQVINNDGTAGSPPAAFVYTSPPPQIFRISPSSGPPTTVVAIEGEYFDARPQNIEVKFNGLSARVVNSTANRIDTVVPFGAATGTVSVTVFGQAVDGPRFTVTAAPTSSNAAPSTFQFIDATSSSGGTTLSFSTSDDAIAYTSLPFAFSLFRDIYLAGSRISISTNGWLSLEPVAAAEFQNTSLPAQTVQRVNGSTGTIPPSLIAPFFDDLILKLGSSVSVRTVGTEPNRKFVVQWSGMSILDENGRDVSAILTFEAILFEGTNDIQFVYQSLSGPRSNGSSATIGIQDLRRVQAVQSGFNQAILGSGLFVTYTFANGEYRATARDSTPPSRPIVTDGGTLTRSRSELFASWVSEDAESGIREFQYAIGRTPGGVEIRPFTSTENNSAVVSGLALEEGATYYFAVKATNQAGLDSEIAVSDGIRVNSAFQPEIRVIPWVTQSSGQFDGIALQALSATSVVLKALAPDGTPAVGRGIRNPMTISLLAGQQWARLVPEIFGLQSFDGWVELESSSPGLNVYNAIGSADLGRLDGSAARDLSSDFLLFHGGATVILANPGSRDANVTITDLGTSGSRSVVVRARSRVSTTISAVVRIQSSEPLAAVEHFGSNERLGIGSPVPASSVQSSLVFPHAVVGGGYTSAAVLANVASLPQDVTLTFNNLSRTARVEAGGWSRISIGELFGLASSTLRTGAVRIQARPPLFGSVTSSLVGVIDIENESSLVTVAAAPAATEMVFPHVAHGGGLFTGLAIASGSQETRVVIEVFEPSGGTPQTGQIALTANSELARVLNELVFSITTQNGGYIRLRSDQPFWALELYGSSRVMASAPPFLR